MSTIRSAFTLYPPLGFPITDRFIMLCRYEHTGPHWVLPGVWHLALVPMQNGTGSALEDVLSSQYQSAMIQSYHQSESYSYTKFNIFQLIKWRHQSINLNLWSYFLELKKSLWHCAGDSPRAIGSDICIAAATVSIQFLSHTKYWLLYKRDRPIKDSTASRDKKLVRISI